MSLKIILLRLLSHLPGAYDLIMCLSECICLVKTTQVEVGTWTADVLVSPQRDICSYKYDIGKISVEFNTLRPRQNRRHFPDDIFKCIFLNENVGIPVKISLKYVPKGPIINIPALVQIMAWRRPGDKPLSDPMMVSLPTHICVTGPQWV